MSTASAIYVIGDTDFDPRWDDDETLVFHVYKGDDDGEAVGKVYTFRRGFDAAMNLAEKMAGNRLEIVVEK